MKTFAQKHPYWFAVIIFALESLVALPFVIVFKINNLDIEPLRLIIPIAQSLFVLWVIFHLGWQKQVGFISRAKNLHLLWFPVILAFLPALLFGTTEINAQGVLFYTLAILFTGISEEGLARGIILRSLLPKGIWISVLGSGVLFSLGHLSNLMFAEMSVIDFLEVLLNTFGFAILYGAVFLRTQSIYPLIILHTLHDFIYVISGTAGPYVVQPLPTSIHFGGAICSILYGVYLIRNLKKEQVLQSMKEFETS